MFLILICSQNHGYPSQWSAASKQFFPSSRFDWILFSAKTTDPHFRNNNNNNNNKQPSTTYNHLQPTTTYNLQATSYNIQPIPLLARKGLPRFLLSRLGIFLPPWKLWYSIVFSRYQGVKCLIPIIQVNEKRRKNKFVCSTSHLSKWNLWLFSSTASLLFK